MNRQRTLALGIAAGLLTVAGSLAALGQPEIGASTLFIGSAAFLALSTEAKSPSRCGRATKTR